MRLSLRYFFCAMAVHFCAVAAQTPGHLDTSFSSSGLHTALPEDADFIPKTIITDDENITLVRSRSTYVGSLFQSIDIVSAAKLLPSGAVDGASVFQPPSLNDDGALSFTVHSSGLYPGDRFYLAGEMRNVTSQQNLLWVGVFDQATGEPSQSFGVAGHFTLEKLGGKGFVRDLVFQSGAQVLLLAGTDVNQVDQMMTIQMSLDGELMTQYGNRNGYNIINVASDIITYHDGVCMFAISNNNMLVVATRLLKDGIFVGLLSPDGALIEQTHFQFPDLRSDAEKNSSMSYANSEVTACARSPTTGGIFIAGLAPGRFWSVARLQRNMIELDNDFGNNGTVVLTDFPSAMVRNRHVRAAVMPTGSLALVGSIGELGAFVNAKMTSTRVLASGELDTEWESSLTGLGFANGTSSRVWDVQMQNNGKMLVSGQHYSPASDGILFRIEAEPGAVPCSAGPQCFCVGAACSTQTDYVAPVDGPSLDGPVFINGNLVASNGTVSVTPFPLGSGVINVGGTAFTDGGTLVITVNQSGTYTIISSDAGVDGQFANVVVSTDELKPCEEGVPTTSVDSVSSGGSTLTVTVTVQRKKGCLTPSELAGVVVGVAVGGILLAVLIIIIAKRQRSSFTTKRNKELKEMEMGQLGEEKRNPHFQQQDL